MTVDKLIKLALVVPALFAVLGTLIINIGLSSYGLFDSQIFRLHAVLVGATFFTFCLAMAVLFCAFTNTVDPSQDSQIRIILLTLWKILIASLALYSMVAASSPSWAGYFLLVIFVFVMIDRLREGEVGRVEKSVFYLSIAASTITGGVEFYALYNLAPEFREVAHLIAAVGFFYYCGVEGRVPIIQKRKADPQLSPYILVRTFHVARNCKMGHCSSGTVSSPQYWGGIVKILHESVPEDPETLGGHEDPREGDRMYRRQSIAWTYPPRDYQRPICGAGQ